MTDVDQQNIGAEMAALKLRLIAEGGPHTGIFGGREMNAAAQAILRLRKSLDVAGKLSEMMVESAMDIVRREGGAKKVGLVATTLAFPCRTPDATRAPCACCEIRLRRVGRLMER